MTYGRLDVFWPDGRFESFSLEEPNVSVGRSNGCNIVLDTDTISRYHFSISKRDDQVTVADMDSANGTFVDGIRLKGNERYPLHGGEEMQIGHLRMIYHAAEDYATTPLEANTQETRMITVADLGFHVEVYGPEIAVPPGSHTSIELSITNETEEQKRFTVQMRGLPEGWARINRPELIINGEDGATVLINVKPLRRSDSTPGEYPFIVEIARQDDLEKRIEANISVRILPYSGFGMALAASKVTAYDSFRLHIHNQGSVGLPVYVVGRSKGDALRFVVKEQHVLLAPGERKVVQGEIHPKKRHLAGTPQEWPFDLMVRSQDEASFLAAVRGYYVQEPVFPPWALVAVGGVAVAVFALLMAALYLVLQVPPAPEIVAFQAGSQSIRQGEALDLSWTAENADSYVVLVNGEVINDDIPGEITEVSILETDPYSGEVDITLQASNRRETVETSMTVMVMEALEVLSFEVEPARLTRNVVEEINISWLVEGATMTRVEGLGSLEPPVSVDPSFGPEGDYTISGVAANNFVLTLIASNDQGATIEETIEMNLANPECLTTTDEFAFYAEPNAGANVISVVESSVTVVVDGRDETGAWLRTTSLPGVEAAWGARTELDCVGFNPEALRIRVTEAPPEITPEPTGNSN